MLYPPTRRDSVHKYMFSVYFMKHFGCIFEKVHFFFPLDGVFRPPLAVEALFRLLLGDGDRSLSLAASAACASSFCFSASKNFCL